MRRFLNITLFALCAVCMVAQIPADYYNAANGKKGEALREAFYSCISKHTELNYSGLEAYYIATDFRPDSTLWDIYSTCEFYRSHGNIPQSDFCQGWNKEHTVPKSWFNSESPMYSDIFHVLPTDARVNGLRGNEAYGETASRTDEISLSDKALGHLGSSTTSGIGKVYEPDDRYKGDIARIYFYMATCYMKKDFTKDGNGAKMFSYLSNTNNLTNYSANLLMKWHRTDPVSYKEMARNDSVYKYQRNRNPYVDFPELAEYIWGDKTSVAFNLSSAISAYSDDYVPYDTEGSDKTDYTKYGVSWYVNGQKIQTDSVFKNHKPAAVPVQPASCSATSSTFMGWSASAITGTSATQPSDLFKAAISAPAINADMSFHAVFAHEEQGHGQGQVTETASFTSADGYKNGKVVESANAGKVTITFNQGSASNPAKFYTTGNAVRCYAGSSFILTGAAMSKVELIAGGEDHTENQIIASTGKLEGNVWTGSTNSLTFSIGGDSKFRSFSAIKVTYDDNTTVFTYSDFITGCGAPSEAIIPVAGQTVARKMIRDGQLYILVGDNIFTITGQKIK